MTCVHAQKSILFHRFWGFYVDGVTGDVPAALHFPRHRDNDCLLREQGDNPTAIMNLDEPPILKVGTESTNSGDMTGPAQGE